MIIHLGTEIRTTFGRTDENGNLVQRIAAEPITLAEIKPGTFADIAVQLLMARKRLEAEEAARQAKSLPPGNGSAEETGEEKKAEVSA